MKIVSVVIQMLEMTNEEENKLWKEWTNHWHPTSPQKVMVCGHEMIDWNTDDGNNCICLKIDDQNSYFSIKRV
jgi:hypothetical protein